MRFSVATVSVAISAALLAACSDKSSFQAPLALSGSTAGGVRPATSYTLYWKPKKVKVKYEGSKIPVATLYYSTNVNPEIQPSSTCYASVADLFTDKTGHQGSLDWTSYKVAWGGGSPGTHCTFVVVNYGDPKGPKAVLKVTIKP